MTATDRIRALTHLLPPMFVLFLLLVTAVAEAKVEYKVYCSAKEMRVSVQLPDSKTQVYIDKLKGYPDCKPEIDDNRAIFHLSLEDFYTCGTTRISDFHGHKIFYNKIIVETTKNKKEKLRVKCGIHGHNLLGIGKPRVQRDVLPPGFYEPDDINITESIIGKGSLPELNVGVRQNGQYIDTQVNVQPGTPLEMEVFLDQNSTDTYGIFINYMNVTDKSPGQKEIIIYKGCSIDPFLFSNFELRNDNRISAKFRAFKFPESNYVMFIGTVKICISECHGVPCSNGQLGYGRRRRREFVEYSDQRDPNEIFEVVMATILMVDQNDHVAVSKGSLGGVAKTEDKPILVPMTKDIEENNDIDNGDKELFTSGSSSLPVTFSLFAILLITQCFQNNFFTRS